VYECAQKRVIDNMSSKIVLLGMWAVVLRESFQ